MKRVLFAVARELRPKLFAPQEEARICAACEVIAADPPASADKGFLLAHVADAEVVITSWGTARLDADVMAEAPKLALLVHAAGTVKPYVSDAVWARKVRVASSAEALAVGVAEYCLGMILLAPKRAFWAGLATREGKWREGINVFAGPAETHRQKVGVIGASRCGRHLIALLKSFTCEVLLYDPYCTAAEAERLGAKKVQTLHELFSQCLLVSLNAPSTDQTRHMIRGEHFRLLRDGAVFINTARGAVVHEREMIEELKKGTFVACIDVTDPAEPPPPDSPLRKLPNVWLTPHQAGAVAQNLFMIGELVAGEIEAFADGRPLTNEVDPEALDHTA